jgi:hypothetical protein
MNTQAATTTDSVALINISRQVWPPRQRTYFGSLVVRSPKDGERFAVTPIAPVIGSLHRDRAKAAQFGLLPPRRAT